MRASAISYANDFLSVTAAQATEGGAKTVLCCFSVNLRRFDPLCRGTHGICSNPAFRGLQLLRAEISAEVRGRGMAPRKADAEACRPFAPRGDWWYHDSLLIEEAPASYPRELLAFSVNTLLGKILSVCAPDARLPDPLPAPTELQHYLESLSTQREKQ